MENFCLRIKEETEKTLERSEQDLNSLPNLAPDSQNQPKLSQSEQALLSPQNLSQPQIPKLSISLEDLPSEPDHLISKQRQKDTKKLSDKQKFQSVSKGLVRKKVQKTNGHNFRITM